MINLFLTPIPDSPMNILIIGTGMIGIIGGILFVKGFTFFEKRYNKNNNSNSDECLPIFIGGIVRRNNRNSNWIFTHYDNSYHTSN